MTGGERGIRTPDTLPGTSVFKTDAINHSASSPLQPSYYRLKIILCHSGVAAPGPRPQRRLPSGNRPNEGPKKPVAA